MLKSAFVWTDDNIAEAAEMWSDGRSMAQIAEFFTISRGSVSGMISRNRALFQNKPPGERAGTRKRERKAEARGKVSKAPPAPREKKFKLVEFPDKPSMFDFSVFQLPDVQPISFLAIGRGQCLWPLSCDDPTAGPDMPCCGAETGGMTYCGPHASIAIGRGTESERTAVRAARRLG